VFADAMAVLAAVGMAEESCQQNIGYLVVCDLGVVQLAARIAEAKGKSFDDTVAHFVTDLVVVLAVADIAATRGRS